jgi:ATP-dependent RNA helicase HelY
MEYRGLTLDPFQEEAIRHLQEGRSVLVAAPTGTGKTIIADWIVDQALQEGKQVIYTAPVKALSNQKFRDYNRLYGDNAGLVTGDLTIRRDAPCVVMTTEILRNMLLSEDAPTNLLAVIIDEIHFLDDRERGTTWEELLIYLPPEVQIVGLSATLSNLDEFSAWLEHVRQRPVGVVVEEQRNVPLEILYYSVDTGLCDRPTYAKRAQRKLNQGPPRDRRSGRDRDRRGGKRGRPQRRTGHLDVVKELSDHFLLPMLYFVFSRRDTELNARGLARKLNGKSLLDDERVAKVEARLREVAGDLGNTLDDNLRNLYTCGIAFHHAGLHVRLKALVESLYEDRLIDVLYCTSTFALGINMPARTVAFDGLHKFNGKTMAPLSVRQFMQKAGRAGRRGMDDVGHVIIRLDPTEFRDAAPLLENYHHGNPEPVRSSFNLSFNSVVNLMDRHGPERARTIVEKSFLNWYLTRQAKGQTKKANQLGKGTGRDHKAARRLQRRAEKAQGRCWRDFQARVGFLQAAGYVDEKFEFAAGATVLRSIQISEIFVTELVLDGVLDDCDAKELFGVCCASTGELPRHVHRNFRPPREHKQLAKRITRIRRSDLVCTAEELSGQQWSWDENLITIGHAWADGDHLEDILMMLQYDTDISGNLIGNFRRAKDLLGQLVDVYKENDPDRAKQIRALIKSVTRDEVVVVG